MDTLGLAVSSLYAELGNVPPGVIQNLYTQILWLFKLFSPLHFCTLYFIINVIWKATKVWRLLNQKGRINRWITYESGTPCVKCMCEQYLNAWQHFQSRHWIEEVGSFYQAHMAAAHMRRGSAKTKLNQNQEPTHWIRFRYDAN